MKRLMTSMWIPTLMVASVFTAAQYAGAQTHQPRMEEAIFRQVNEHRARHDDGPKGPLALNRSLQQAARAEDGRPREASPRAPERGRADDW